MNRAVKKAPSKKSKKPRLFVFVESGLIQNIIADQKVEVMVLDGDVAGFDEDQLKTYTDLINGSKFRAREAWDKVDVNKKVVDHYFRQRS